MSNFYTIMIIVLAILIVILLSYLPSEEIKKCQKNSSMSLPGLRMNLCGQLVFSESRFVVCNDLNYIWVLYLGPVMYSLIRSNILIPKKTIAIIFRTNWQ